MLPCALLVPVRVLVCTMPPHSRNKGALPRHVAAAATLSFYSRDSSSAPNGSGERPFVPGRRLAPQTDCLWCGRFETAREDHHPEFQRVSPTPPSHEARLLIPSRPCSFIAICESPAFHPPPRLTGRKATFSSYAVRSRSSPPTAPPSRTNSFPSSSASTSS